MVGVTGFEPATSRPPDVRATKLRYTPTKEKSRYTNTSLSTGQSLPPL